MGHPPEGGLYQENSKSTPSTSSAHIGFPRISAEYDTLVTVTLREALGYVGWSEECTVSTLTGAGTAGWESQLTPHSQSVSFTIWQSDSEV